MSSLVIDAVRCREETDEIGSDDVYVVVFRGDPKAPFGSNLVFTAPDRFGATSTPPSSKEQTFQSRNSSRMPFMSSCSWRRTTPETFLARK